MSYELIHEDENSYHLKHPEGHKIQIAKSAISDVLHQRIKSFYKGGDVSSDTTDEALSALGATGKEDPLLKSDEPSKKESGLLSDVGEGLKQAKDTILTSLPESPNLYDDSKNQTPPMSDYYNQTAYKAPGNDVLAGAQPPGAPIAGIQPQRDALPLQSAVPIGGEATPQAQPNAPAGQGAYVPKDASMGNIEQAQKQQAGAAHMLSQAQQDVGKQQERVLADAQSAQIEFQNNYADKMAKLDRATGEARDAYASGKIDPQRLWHEAGTGGRIAAGIGLILGGIGAGLTGGPNQAVAMMDKLIERDIDAQKADLGKKHSLYSMYLQQTHNENTAHSMAKLDMATAVQGQLQMISARSATPMAKAAEAKFNADANMAMVPLKNDIAKWTAGQGLLYGQGGAGGNEARLAQAENMLFDDKTRERIVHVPGPNGLRPVLAPDKEGADNFRKSEIEHNKLDSQIDTAINFMKEHGTLVNPFSQAKGQSEVIHNSLVLSMGKLHDLNRLNERELDMFKEMVPNLGQMNTNQGIAKLQQLKNELADNRNAAYQQLTPGYNPGKFKKLEGAPRR